MWWYWLIFPPKQQPELLQNEADTLLVPPFLPQLKLTVGDIFSWLKF
jgi:Uma2 family endonuclease